ncbi:hypothetical protein [Kribbella sp. NPDC049584]|uniref:DUF7878 domain-containing protein n=1 Tax=Kribbella sp. NPDC049584 TaxID=3154833 RepID=UPI00342E438B
MVFRRQETRIGVRAMLLTYGKLDVSELQATTQADVLVAVDAGFRVVDGDRVVYEEPSFPVVELAWSLLRWLDQPARGDFVFDSMSFEELGALTVRRQGAGWVFGSVFVPDIASDPVSWGEVERSVRAFTRRVTADLSAVGLDATDVLRYPPAR